jgi:hypothetical protein
LALFIRLTTKTFVAALSRTFGHAIDQEVRDDTAARADNDQVGLQDGLFGSWIEGGSRLERELERPDGSRCWRWRPRP